MFEIYELRYGVKVARNNVAAKLKEYQDLKDTSVFPPPPPKGTRPPKDKPALAEVPRPKKVEERIPQSRDIRKLRKDIKKEVRDTLHFMDYLLSLSDILDDIMQGKFEEELEPYTKKPIVENLLDEEALESYAANHLEQIEKEIEQKEMAKRSKFKDKTPQVPKKSTAKQPGNSGTESIPDATPKSTESIPEVAEGNGSETPEVLTKTQKADINNAKYTINEDNLIPNYEDSIYEQLFQVTPVRALPETHRGRKEETNIDTPPDETPPEKTEPTPKRPYKRAILRMRPYPLDPINAKEIADIHAHNIKTLHRIMDDPRIYSTMSGLYVEVRKSFTKAKAPFTLSTLCELFAGYQSMGSLKSTIAIPTEYEWFPTRSDLLPIVSSAINPAHQHARYSSYPKEKKKRKYKNGRGRPYIGKFKPSKKTKSNNPRGKSKIFT